MHSNTVAPPSPLLASALSAAGFGQELIPIQPGQKRCLVAGWPTMRIKPEMRVIAVSGLPPESTTDYPQGIKSFLRKPFSTTTLLSTIQSVLDA